MKKLAGIIVMALTITTSIFGQNIKLKIDGKSVSSIVEPVQEQGITLVPLRVVSENLGASVGWEQSREIIDTITSPSRP